MVGRDFSANREELVLGNAEFHELQLRLDLGARKTLTLGLRHVLHLGAANTELESRIAVLILGPVSDDLTAVDLEDRDRHMFTSVCKDAGHADLLCDDT